MKKFYLLFLSVFNIVAFAQTYDYTLYHPNNSGITSANINDIKIDSGGALWLATYGALTTFNGTAFTNYTTANSQIQASDLKKITIDNLNRKWIATGENGVILFNGSIFINYRSTNSPLPNNVINDIAVDNLNNVWIATYSGLVKFNGTTWTTYNTTNSEIYSNTVTSVATDSNNNVYLTLNGILMKFNGTAFSIIGDQAYKIHKIANNDLYVTTQQGGYLKYTNGEVSDGQFYNNSCMLDCQIEGIDVDQNNKVWLGFSRECANGGLQNFTDCHNYIPAVAGAAFDYVSCLKVQNSSTIWVGTYENGLVKMSLHTSGTTCNAPTNLSVTNLNPTSATFNWTAASPAPNGYAFVYANTNNFGSGITGYTTSTSVTVDGLNPNGDYYWWVASDCGTSQSEWTAGGFFPTPQVPAPVVCYQKVSAGSDHSIGLKTDGTLWTWGSNSAGQLGFSTTITQKNVPTQVGAASNWQNITASGNGTYAIKSDGTLWAWGNNNFGQLGDGTTINRTTPTRIGTAINYANVGIGQNHTVAVKTDGTIWAWGWNSSGQLGDGTTTDKTSPTRIGTATNWKNVSGGSLHTVAVKTDGTLWTWGSNSSGQLGDGTNTNRNIPTQIGTATNWDTVAAGGELTVARKTDGSLWAWGNNNSGQLGDGTTVNKNVPTRIGTGTNWQTVEVGIFHVLAVKTDGTLWAWGRNAYSQLGDGTETNRTVPTQIGIAANWKGISGDAFHSLGVKTDGSVSSWGYNFSGQLGDGTTTDRTIPTAIACASTLEVDNFAVANEMKVYPNPVNDVLNVSFDATISKITIYNMLGQEVIAKSVNAKESKIDVSALHSGTYFVKADAGNLVKTLKIIKR
ncbi:hypothetical protein FNO01nite_18050 [Flavobacterium noncentrifugens]|uniref:Por secretion system C-terminal sorting domain-containing protein n=1 Tax=Flavobacterium noncentrifugens TaxID=1128970 RepID=A0A1G8Y985_9FLAO|nr:T9SS type A sorting domain-containing protein [Flavobacterium noncentrifugens]GEP51133.1 hypothetical protein FNO01nite_18050 [Flavobacterium noncentrifugens]SDJ99247.1 Por secretion system C-terminal sorting domain-containing protein [Flavobacterium noncentrifugens]